MSKIVNMIYIDELENFYEIERWHSVKSLTVFNDVVTIKLQFTKPVHEISSIFEVSFKETK